MYSTMPAPPLPLQGYQSELDPVEAQIHQFFDQLMACVHQRREGLLNTYRQKRDEQSTNRSTRIAKEEELNKLRTETEDRMVEVEIRGVLRQLVAEIDHKLGEVRESQPDYRMLFWGDHGSLIEMIGSLGQVYQEEIPTVVTPVVVTGRRGEGPGELNNPWGVAIDDTTKRIYVVEGRETCRISVFSETGEFVEAVKHGDINQPHGIAIQGDDMYVTDVMAHKVFRFTLTHPIRLVCAIGSMGAENGEFNTPLGISVSPEGEVLVADLKNNRIQILEKTLHFKRVLRDESIYQPMDVKQTADEVLVLCNTSPCMHVFSTAGEKLREIITRGTGCDVTNAIFFCVDAKMNIVVSDGGIDQVRTFSKEGTRVRSIGGRGDQPGQFLEVIGIDIGSGNNMAVVSYNPNFVLQIFRVQ